MYSFSTNSCRDQKAWEKLASSAMQGLSSLDIGVYEKITASSKERENIATNCSDLLRVPCRPCKPRRAGNLVAPG